MHIRSAKWSHVQQPLHETTIFLRGQYPRPRMIMGLCGATWNRCLESSPNESMCCCSFWEKAFKPLTSQFSCSNGASPLRQTPTRSTLGPHSYAEHTVLAFCVCFCCRDIGSFCVHWILVTSDPSPPAPLSAFEPRKCCSLSLARC